MAVIIRTGVVLIFIDVVSMSEVDVCAKFLDIIVGSNQNFPTLGLA